MVTTLRIKLALLLVTVGAVLAGLSIVFSQNAKADNTDSAFLAALVSQHVPLPREGISAILVGHDVCEFIGNGDTPGNVASEIQAANRESGYTAADAGHFVGASVKAYCPQYGDSVAITGIAA